MSSHIVENKKINMSEELKVKGHVRIYTFPAELVPDYQTYLKLQDKEKYLRFEGDNTISSLGFNLIAIILSGGTNTMTHTGVGTGSPTTTALGTEVGTRMVIASVGSKYAINNEYHIDTFYGKNDPNSSSNILTEAGIFNQLAVGGEMYSSKAISITKDNTITMVLAWLWSFA